MSQLQKHRILISRPDRIGDVVLSTPLPREIKKQYPDSYVAVLVRSYTGDIFLNNPFVDEIIFADEILAAKKKDFIKHLKKIRNYNFSHALMLLPNERINYLLFLAGIRTRIGVGHKFYQFIAGVKSVDRNKYIPLRHEADYCMDLARKIGVAADDFLPEIYLSDSEKRKSENIRSELLGGRKFLVGIHSTSGNSAPNWKAEEYRNLIDQLKRNKNYQIVCTDNDIPNDLADLENVIYPNVHKTLRESILNLSALDLLISASTGPMHICSALKVKTVSLFCPLTACSPKLWGPLGNESKVILPQEGYCQNQCPGDPKVCTFAGEGGINLDIVISKVEELLSE